MSRVSGVKGGEGERGERVAEARHDRLGSPDRLGADTRLGAGAPLGADARLDPRRAVGWLRGVVTELRDLSHDPMPPSLWLRWLPHGLVVLAAIVVLLANMDQLLDGYHLSVEFAVLCGLAQSAAVVLAPWLPMPAWWLSLAAFVATALGAREELFGDSPLVGNPGPGGSPGPGVPDQLPVDPSLANAPWPWGPAAMGGHALVLFLLALRVRTPVSTAAVGVTALVTWIIQGVLGGTQYTSTGTVAVALFTGVTLLGAALRGRRVARVELVEQAGITAEERARRTLLEERSRIARELHDVVAHHMSVISIQAQVAPHLVENPSDELRENLDGIRQNALEALTELRRVLGVLRSEDPDDAAGLGAGVAPDAPQPTLDRLDDLIDNTRAAGLTITTDIVGEPARPYPPGMELSAYRIVQEALSNALRHAPGSDVRVEITHFPEGLYLGVINSRPSHPVQPSPGAGHGLLGMRERATMLGGQLTATRTLQGGYSVSAFLPRDSTSLAPPDETGTPIRIHFPKDFP